MLCLCTDVEPWIPKVKLCKSTLIILNRINAIKNCVHHIKGRLISAVVVVITPMNPYQPIAEKVFEKNGIFSQKTSVNIDN